MITLNKAKALALETMAHLTGLEPAQLAFIDHLTQCKRTGWIFFYESRAYLEGGNVADAIGRTGPVIVSHRGVVHALSCTGGRPVGEAIAEYENRVAEHTTRS
jgi:hypothetical protein